MQTSAETLFASSHRCQASGRLRCSAGERVSLNRVAVCRLLAPFNAIAINAADWPGELRAAVGVVVPVLAGDGAGAVTIVGGAGPLTTAVWTLPIVPIGFPVANGGVGAVHLTDDCVSAVPDYLRLNRFRHMFFLFRFCC